MATPLQQAAQQTQQNAPFNNFNLQQAAQQLLGGQSAGNFGVPQQPQTIEQQINSMPNANRLTDSERWIYNRLPGVNTWMENNRIMGRTVSEQLERFNNGWLGKALQKLDVFAEGLERTSGLALQLRDDPNFDFSELKAAWYAGSLTYDVSNLPVLKKDENGNVIGMTIPADLPGSEGLGHARTQIAKYMSMGMSAQDALAKVRDDYYGGLGALALRAQLNDLYGHVLLDPLNFITAYLKPVQALKARRFTALTKIAGGTEEVLADVARVSDLAKSAENISDALKFTDEAYRLSQMAGDVEGAVRYAQEAADIAKKAGNAQDAAKYLDDVARLKNMTPEEITQFSDDALRMLGKKTLTTQDKFIIMATGGDPFRPSEFGKKLGKVPILGRIANEFALTPESKAKELMTLMSDNYRNVIGRLINDVDAEQKFVEYASRVGKGATGVEYGHAMMSVQGRTVQAFSKGVEADLARIFDGWQGTRTSRELLDSVAQTVGEAPTKLLKMMDENPEAVMKMLAKYADRNPALALRLQNGELDADALRSISKILKDIPHNREMFFAQALDAIETHAMRQAIIQFGVKEKGVLTRWSDAMKAAESLAFLKLNPAYPIRNKINNDLTMIARGVFGFMPDSAIDDFWKGFGYTPARLGSGQTPLGEKVLEGMSEAEKLLEQALRGGNYSTPEQVRKFFANINLGKMDFAGYWGQRIEQAASKKAYTLGTRQGVDLYMKQVKMTDYFSPNLIRAMDEIDPSISQKIQNAIRSSDAVDAKFTQVLGENLNTSVDNILDDVTNRVGYDVREMLGDELLHHLKDTLPNAIKSGNVDALKADIRTGLERHIEDLFQKQLENVVEETKAMVQAGGPNVWNQKLLESREMFYGARIDYSIRMPEATRAAREASLSGDWARARALWEQEALDARMYHDRLFRRMDAIIEGMEQGAKELGQKGVKLPFAETKKTFKAFKRNWEDFFKQKNALVENFWNEVKTKPKGQQPSWDDVHNKLNDMYAKAVKKEDDLVQALDDHVAGLIDDPQIRQAYVSARDKLAELNTLDKNAVADVFEQASRAAPEDRQAIWNAFWQERTARYNQMREVEAQSIMIQQGDPRALATYSKPSQGGIYDLANQYGIPSASEAGVRNDRRILNTVNKYLPEGQPKYKNVADIPEDVARQAFEARALEKGTPTPSQVKPNFIADIKKAFPAQPPLDLGMDQAAYGKIQNTLDAVIDGAKRAMNEPPLLIKNLPEDMQQQVMRGLENARNGLADVRYRSMKFGEWRRDSALLNYNRRTNFDNQLGHFAPFVFWSTSSMWQWAIESIDRPAMLTNYLRIRKFMDTAGLQRDGSIASRTKGKIRIKLPFAPEWMGEAFIDPLRVALPFDNWLTPFDQFQKDQQGFDGRVVRVLDQMLNEGSLTQEEYDEAVAGKSGAAWDYAEATAQQNEEGDRQDSWDFATSLASPHAPIMWAYNAAFGDKQDIGPFAPASRIFRNAATLMGVEDWNNSKWNIEAKIRRQLGLPAFDKWDDYRIKRSASNLAGEGKLTPDEAKEAIAVAALVEQGRMTPEQAKEASEAYRMAVARSNQEFTGGGASFALSLLGLSVTNVPQGENNLRALQDDFGIAYGKYKEANDSLEKFIKSHPEMDRNAASDLWERQNPKLAKDADALGDFFDAHPEYETRLGLFDKPEEQVHKFYVDNMWSVWNTLPKVNQDEVKEHLGVEFQESFLNKETRSYDSIPVETMAVWLKMMNVDPIGGLTADQRLLVSLYGKVKFTDPETANRVQIFYDNRKQNFPDYYKKQSEYYQLPQKDRKRYLSANPDLQQYFDFRRQFMFDNPDLVPYLTDNQKAIEKAQRQTRTVRAVPTAQELQAQVSPTLGFFLNQYYQGGELPREAEEYLELMGQNYGMTGDQVLQVLGGGQGIR